MFCEYLNESAFYSHTYAEKRWYETHLAKHGNNFSLEWEGGEFETIIL